MIRAAFIALLAVTAACSEAAEPDRLSAEAIGRALSDQKPGAGVPGDDSCPFANDNECDEPGLGTGACQAGTDRSDCWRLIAGVEDDTCRFADDGECDEPGYGTGACVQGSDRSDCEGVAALRFHDDSCESAFNGVCEEPRSEGQSSACAPRTDRSDCIGRDRALTLTDHFFGRDDRVRIDTAARPWDALGRFDHGPGGSCTATLVADAVIVTAAHCVSTEDGVDARGVFRIGDGFAAKSVDVLVAPDWDIAVFDAGETLDGADWALIRIDPPAGGAAAPVPPLSRAPRRGDRLSQAGYSWDTGEAPSGDPDCEVLEVFAGGAVAHDCDTTRGDSGSPLMIDTPEGWRVLASDSNFRRNPDGPYVYIASAASGWAGRLDAFARGEIGAGGPVIEGRGAGAEPTAKPRR